MEMLRENFLRIFADLPLNLRDDAVLVYKDEPVSWRAAYLEIKNKTEKGTEMLAILSDLQII